MSAALPSSPCAVNSAGNVTAAVFLKWRRSCAQDLDSLLCALSAALLSDFGVFFITLQRVNKFSDWNLTEVAAALPNIAPIFFVFGP